MFGNNRVLEFTIRCRNKATEAIYAIMRNLANLKAGFEMLKTAAGAAMLFLRKAFQFETMTVQFKTLIGNMDAAREHMKMLQELGNTPPFSLEEFAAASRAMMVMSDGALGYKKSLELVGDAAAATGVPIQSLAHEVGRAYAIIRDGQPLTRATMALRNMGVITPDVAAKLTELQEAGATNIEIWNEFEAALKKYQGAMEETEQTGNGMIGAIQSEWDNTVRTFGEAFMETAKDGIGALLEKMRELREDGTIAVWADKAKKCIDSVAGSIKTCASVLSFFWNECGLSDIWHNTKGMVVATGEFLGTLVGGLSEGQGIGDALKAAGKAGNEATTIESAKGHWTGKLLRNHGDETTKKILAESDKIDKDEEAGIRRKAQDKDKKEKEEKEKDAAEAAAKAEAERKRIEEEMAKKQAELDAKRAAEQERLAKEQAEKEMRLAEEAARKQAEAEERERLRIEALIAKERQRLWNEQINQQRKDLQAANQEDAAARQRLAAAEQATQQAWGWYRNKDSWKAQLEEERANAEAEKQFAKDEAKLKSHVGWRSAKLSDDDELIRRVVLAREEEQAARAYAKQTAEACARAAEALESMENTIVGEG